MTFKVNQSEFQSYLNTTFIQFRILYQLYNWGKETPCSITNIQSKEQKLKNRLKKVISEKGNKVRVTDRSLIDPNTRPETKEEKLPRLKSISSLENALCVNPT